MKKFLVLITLALLTACSCKTMITKDVMLQVEETNNKKLPTLDTRYSSATSASLAYGDPKFSIFNPEDKHAILFYDMVQNQLIDPYGDKRGTIELVDKTEEKPGFGSLWIWPSICTYGVANLLGMPFWQEKVYSEVHVRILDRRDKVVKKYYAKVEKEQYWAKWSDCAEDLKLSAYRLALEDIMSQIQKDYDYLYTKLK